jgi:hypothetical protein
MLVATFAANTAWEGREIIWDVDHFILVGHGGVPAAGVLDYDRRGQLVWAAPELRPWVRQVADWEAAGRPAGPARPAGGAATRPAPGTLGGRLPTWAFVLIIVAVCLVVLGLVAAFVIPDLVIRTGQTIAHDATVRSNMRTIQVGIESYAVEHAGTYPPAREVNAVGLSRYLTDWPANPYTGLPMVPGAGPGNFSYEAGTGGKSYRLIGYGRDGTVVIELRGGSAATV